MREEVEAWLNSLVLPIGRLSMRWDLPIMAVVEASEIVYDKICSGEEIKPIRIGWNIRAIAEAISKRHDIEEVRALSTAHETIDSLRAEMASIIKEYEDDIDSLRLKLEEKGLSMWGKTWRFLTKKRSLRRKK